MPHFLSFVYRFLAAILLFTLASCFSDYEPAEEEAPPQPSATSAATPAAQSTQTPVSPAPIAPPANMQPPAKEGYAPPSHITNDTASSGSAVSGAFAPASHIGEAVSAPVVKVGLLIPMSGSASELGRSLLDAAVLAIYDKYSTLSSHDITAKLELLPEDTGDSIEGGEKAAQDAIQAGATLLLGPVFSKQVSAIAGLARRKNIPLITFSNNAVIAGNGVYLFGFVPEQQVTRIVQYALSRKYTNIATLVPSTPYGAAIVKQLSSEARKGGGRARPIEYYPENLSNLDINVGRLARLLEEQGQKNKSQALFIAEGGSKLKAITDTLSSNGLNYAGVQLLGTGLWDDADIIKWPALYGGWFASSPPEKYHTFEQHFTSTYNYRPDRRASLSYDAVALAATLAITASGKPFTSAMLIDPVGFSGPANGIFRFHDDGTIDRGLSVLTVTPAGFKTVDPAPTMFNQ